MKHANIAYSLVPLVSQLPDIIESKQGRASKKSGEGKDYTDFDSSFFFIDDSELKELPPQRAYKNL